MSLLITQARSAEAADILQLQYLCYQSEAEIYRDLSIPPLTQTLESLIEEIATQRVLVARFGTDIIGSVRARLTEGICHIGRLIVHPQRQRQGIGSQLMAQIEDQFPEALRFHLFTGHRSDGNLRLYRRLGYYEFKREVISPNLVLVHMEKSR